MDMDVVVTAADTRAMLMRAAGFASTKATRAYFDVSNAYVLTKVIMVFTPFLRKWKFIRQRRSYDLSRRSAAGR